MAQQCPASAGLSLSDAECRGPLPPTGRKSDVPEHDFRPGGPVRNAAMFPDCHAVRFGDIGGAAEHKWRRKI